MGFHKKGKLDVVDKMFSNDRYLNSKRNDIKKAQIVIFNPYFISSLKYTNKASDVEILHRFLQCVGKKLFNLGRYLCTVGLIA